MINFLVHIYSDLYYSNDTCYSQYDIEEMCEH